MELEYWKERWENNNIGFHREKVNGLLENHFGKLKLEAIDRVLVPLCGKSIDLVWLASQGLKVDGIEISKIAVMDFFNENKINFKEEGSRIGNEDLGIYCQDFQEFSGPDSVKYSAIYDRAALIALPPKMRRAYAEKIRQIAQKGCRYLLIALSYPQELIDGPPFSVDSMEVSNLFGEDFTIQNLEMAITENISPKMKAAGMDHVLETAYLLTKN